MEKVVIEKSTLQTVERYLKGDVSFYVVKDNLAVKKPLLFILDFNKFWTQMFLTFIDTEEAVKFIMNTKKLKNYIPSYYRGLKEAYKYLGIEDGEYPSIQTLLSSSFDLTVEFVRPIEEEQRRIILDNMHLVIQGQLTPTDLTHSTLLPYLQVLSYIFGVKKI
jgi:hypothetical protein